MSLSLVLCLILFTGVQSAPSDVNRGIMRIVNGTKAPPGRFPYMVSLQSDNEHFCGGTVLSDKWILTAAHCVEEEMPENLNILAGTVNLKTGGVTRNVKRIIIHGSYDADNNYENDIAVLELESPLPTSTDPNIEPFILPSEGQSTPVNTTAIILGWGYIESGGPTSDDLMMVEVLTYSDENCDELLQGNTHPTNICAGVPGGGKGHCGGDSGGPLIVNQDVQIGIVSWSVKPCASPPYPGVYTEVPHYVTWIQTQINNSG